jgi:uncharacterized membrane protein YtjA (UPF0391 family)
LFPFGSGYISGPGATHASLLGLFLVANHKPSGRRLAPQPGAILNPRSITMLRWALIFFIVAIVAALFGFTGIAGAAAGAAKIIFTIFIVLLLIALLAQALGGRPPPST